MKKFTWLELNQALMSRGVRPAEILNIRTELYHQKEKAKEHTNLIKNKLDYFPCD